jgi:Tfp pilus assembly ATPase PilU
MCFIILQLGLTGAQTTTSMESDDGFRFKPIIGTVIIVEDTVALFFLNFFCIIFDSKVITECVFHPIVSKRSTFFVDQDD